MDTRGQFVASLLDASSRALAAGVVNRLVDPENAGEPAGGFQSRLADVESRIAHLAESLAVGSTGLFVSHVEWLRNAYEAREVPLEVLDASLACLRDELAEQLGDEHMNMVVPQVDAAMTALRGDSNAPRSLAEGPHNDYTRSFMLYQLEGRLGEALALIESALDKGVSISDIEVHVIGRAQAEIGLMWQRGEVQIAEEHMGSAIVEEAIALLSRRIDTPVRADRRVLVASVAGNMHDFGARVVSHHFRMGGWRTYFLGADTPVEDVLWAVGEYEPQVLALSIALPLQVRTTARLIERLRSSSSRDVKVVVGGAPIVAVPELWSAMGADLGATDVQTLVESVERLIAG